MHITMVKKILADGTPCRKCMDVEQRLHEQSLLGKIDTIEIADERDPESPGMQLARKYQVQNAPFFIVEQEGKPPAIYTVYFQFIKEIFKSGTSASEEDVEIMDMNPDIDFL